MNQVFKKAEQFIYQNARPIDLARWQYHFEHGSKENVLKALSKYQNEDGGFGHGLEADSLNPNSSPIQTWAAAEILKEIDITDKDNHIVQGILAYLESGKDFDGHYWGNVVPTNNDYPHAPWWEHPHSPWWQDTEENRFSVHYNPTAHLSGFALYLARPDSKLYQLTKMIAQEAIGAFLNIEAINDMHVVSCFIRLYEYLTAAGLAARFDTARLEQKLMDIVKSNITQDKSKWGIEYICKPSQFFNSNTSIFYPDSQEIADFECEFIQKTQLDDGSWSIPWEWGNDPEEWALSKNWWKANGILINMLYLKGMDHLHLPHA
jgi:hypothetical protein